MQVTLGAKGCQETWQDPFAATEKCDACGGEARIAFVAHEARHEGPTPPLVCMLHENTYGQKDGNGKFWPHDAVAVAVYFCSRCARAVARFNQA